MSMARPDPYAPTGMAHALESAAAWTLAIVWVLPLAYAVWARRDPGGGAPWAALAIARYALARRLAG